MADFVEAHEHLMTVEGGYKLINRTNDLGRQTYAGISRRANPQWEGWKLIDNGISPDHPELKKLADSFFEVEYWLRLRCHEVQDQEVGETIYSCAVLSSQHKAGQLTQMAAEVIPMDGIVGPQTIAAVNAIDPELFVLRLGLLRIARYVAICNKHPSQIDNLKGWLNRVLGEVAAESEVL